MRYPVAAPDAMLATRPALLLAPILFGQLAFSLARIDEPNLDGRLHWYWENARFLHAARHSNHEPATPVASRARSALKVFGTARYGYDERGRVARLDFYSHHPVLSPALFRGYARVFGYDPWVPRSLMLLLSLATTLVLYAFLRAVLRDDWLSAGLTLLYCLLPLNFMYMDQWKFENLANLLLLSSLFLLLGAGPGRAGRALLLAVLFLLLQTDWNVYFAVPLLLLYAHRRRGEPGCRALFAQASAVCLLSVTVNFAVLYALGFDLDTMRSEGAWRMGGGLRGLEDAGPWLWKQAVYLRLNFGAAGVAAMGLGLLLLLHPRARRPNPLLLASAAFFAAGVLWVGVFRNLSHIHHFVQWSFGTAAVLLWGGLLANAPSAQRRSGRARAAAALLLAAVLVPTAWSARDFYRRTRAATVGEAGDLEAIRALGSRRLILLPDGSSGPPGWWESPVVHLLQDPIFRQREEPEGSVRRIELVRSLDPASDLFVILRTRRAAASLRELAEARLGVRGFELVRESPTFRFLRPAAAPDARGS